MRSVNVVCVQYYRYLDQLEGRYTAYQCVVSSAIKCERAREQLACPAQTVFLLLSLLPIAGSAGGLSLSNRDRMEVEERKNMGGI